MATHQELREQAARLLAQAEEQRKVEMQQHLDAISLLVREHGIGLGDLWDYLVERGFEGKTRYEAPPRPRAQNKRAYVNPETGETWAGSGRTPRWLRDAMGLGMAKESFLMDPDSRG